MSPISAVIVCVLAAIVGASPIAREAHRVPPAVLTYTGWMTIETGIRQAVPVATPTMPLTVATKVITVIATDTAAPTASPGPTWEDTGFGALPEIHGPAPIAQPVGDAVPTRPRPDDGRGRPQPSSVHPGIVIGRDPQLPPYFDSSVGWNARHVPGSHQGEGHGRADPEPPHSGPAPVAGGDMPHVTPRPVPVTRTEPSMRWESW
ncbi:MAG: hypothetical protein Q9211_005552 [Gyalolechia sp. 1 TL-2023]